MKEIKIDFNKEQLRRAGIVVFGFLTLCSIHACITPANSDWTAWVMFWLFSIGIGLFSVVVPLVIINYIRWGTDW